MNIIRATSKSGSGFVYLVKISGLQLTMSPKKSDAIVVDKDLESTWIRSVRMSFPDAVVENDSVQPLKSSL